jgi:hypothetical protein
MKPYAIGERVWSLEPMEIRSGGATLVILMTPDHVTNVAWELYSFLKALKSPINVTVVLDGEWGGKRHLLETLFRGVKFGNTRECVERVGGKMPELKKLAEVHPMGGKMAVILDFHERGDIVFCDDDLLVFGEIPEVEDWLNHSDRGNLYIQDVQGVCAEPSLLQGVQKLGLSYANTINVGFMLIRKDSLDVKVVEDILRASPSIQTWFPDTMLLAVLMHQAQAGPLPRDRYVVSALRQFWHEADIDYQCIALRHFTQPVRHVMYLHGMPFLWRKWHGQG